MSDKDLYTAADKLGLLRITNEWKGKKMPKYSVETVREVWDDEGGYYYEVGPDRDGTDAVEIRAKDNKGNIEARMTIIPAMAELIGEAMIACAKELQAPKK